MNEKLEQLRDYIVDLHKYNLIPCSEYFNLLIKIDNIELELDKLLIKESIKL